jgi:hypothetical protein
MLNDRRGVGDEAIAEDESGQEGNEREEGIESDSGGDQAEIVVPGFPPSPQRNLLPASRRKIGRAGGLFIDSRLFVRIHYRP